MKIPFLHRLTWRSQMIILSLVLLFFLGSGVTFAINQERERHFHEFMVELVTPMESLVYNNIVHNMKYHGPNHFQTILQGLSGNEKIRWVKVLNRTFEVVFSNDTTLIGEQDSIPSRYAPDLVSGQLIAYTKPDSGRLLRIVDGVPNEPFCYRCHGSDAAVNGYIEIGINDSPEIRAEAMMLRYDFTLFFFFILVLSAILGIVHHRTFQKPLTELKEGIRRIESGDLSTRVVLDTPGELRGLAEHISRMTEKLEASQKEVEKLHQEQIERAGQLASVGELAASVAHEIKNPVSGIHNALEILMDQNRELRENPIYKEMLTQINRVTRTIHDLMDYAKPREPKMETTDVHQLLEQVVALQRPKITSEHIRLDVRLEARPSTILGDSDLLKQAFANLLLNAYQACSGQQEETITVATETVESSAIAIHIRNTGSWISSDMIDKVFKPFYTTKHKGTGLGLSLTKSIVEKHRGTISVRSESYQWVEFTIQLPLGSRQEGATA
ncbi:MAG: sensor histidine kinase [Candidatus Neomarinimicrobiota bacterium]|nr:MAG: sensor histidine kinase [Candidatus Neomarinimicrobiota bacterium]